MNLIIDIGNTKIKFALFERQTLLVKGVGDSGDLKSFIDKKKINYSIVSSVTKNKRVYQILEEAGIKYLILSHETNLPFSNNYLTKNTLGADRVANMAAVAVSFPAKNRLVIDCGTCIKFDFLSKDDKYSGGAISPGLEMRFKALNHYTGALPLIKPESIDYFIGRTSKESILSGVVNGCVQEIEGVISQYQAIYEKLTLILTGGDATFFDNELKSNIFVESNLTLIGLNEILLYNNYTQ